MAYVTDGTIGIDVTRVATSAEFTVGKIHSGTDASQWQYVKASSAVAQYDIVSIASTGFAAPLTNTLAAAIKSVGFAQVAIASGSYGWVAKSGNGLSVTTAGAVVAGAKVTSTATAGAIDDAAGAGTYTLHGVVATTGTGGAGTAVINAVNPHLDSTAN